MQVIAGQCEKLQVNASYNCKSHIPSQCEMTENVIVLFTIPSLWFTTLLHLYACTRYQSPI